MTLNWEELSNPLKVDTLQRNSDKLQGWAITNHRKFNKSKYWILHEGQGIPGCTNRLESSHTERNLGSLVNSKLNMGQQYPGSQEGQPCHGGHQVQQHQPGEGGEFLYQHK